MTPRPSPHDPCPCGGIAWSECCGAYVADDALAPTAEALMRSRFSAFAVGDEAHIARTWHPSTRPDDLDLDDATTWVRLAILDTVAGGPGDDRGEVEFVAVFRPGGGGPRLRMHERSRFVREGGAWLYVDGDVAG